ncbi:ogr/Delta-like zinc finger family protein [Aggregatibacter actinomycetemcomitans]|uniref:ogr/Delta-like zinc finger family protein n=1 Tax=Aggregatibacter actinomycetemcomitans TaxID=714 RepID=UPI00197C3D7E|nr:ogr/Delta-like zinc finger family protein [Aggregatibacter actinomycetemcomitans]MBN6067863.1 ogr/Delta-like zinc finger family protein [Aggregatibacter actinomycetemcomitans]MBN6085800.1 ogr/Delta-like zinc finger family protein [Aggregatibacter actinomycetemcomitans]
MARTSDIYCKVCKQKAVIRRTERIHSEFSRLYCDCKNPACRHKFVMNLEFSHSTSSSLLTKDQLLALTLSQLSEDDKNRIRKMLDEEKAA